MSLTSHEAKVARVRATLMERPEGMRVSVRKDSVSHTIKDLSWKKQCHRVDVSDLHEILGFVKDTDRDGNTVDAAVCEGQVQMGQLVKACMTHGLVPRVVPEDMSFTCSGLVNGEGIQTSCFRWGLFSYNVLEVECVLGDGAVVTARYDNEYRDLFMGLFESYGSLGIVTKVVVALCPCRRFVESHYTHFDNLEAFVAAIDHKARHKTSDYLEGLMLARDSFLITESYFTDDDDGLPHFLPYPEDNTTGNPYYYQYLQDTVLRRNAKSGKMSVAISADVIETFDFLFRSRRGAWWMVECFVGNKWLCRQRWFRRFVDKLGAQQKTPENTIMTVGHLSIAEIQRCTILQDMGVRLKRLAEGLQWVIDNVGVYPTWVCPVHHPDWNERLAARPFSKVPVGDPENCYFCDIGLYGEPTVRPYFHRRVMRALQEFVDYPSKWGVSYFTKEELRKELAPLRAKYHAESAFVPFEDKVAIHDAAKDAVDNEGMIYQWRLYRDYGKYWPVKLSVAAAFVLGLLFVALSKLFFGSVWWWSTSGVAARSSVAGPVSLLHAL